MRNLAIVIVALPPSIDDVYANWAAEAPEWFDGLREKGRVTCSKSGAELAERGINLPRLCELLNIEDDADGFTAGLRELDVSLAALDGGTIDLVDFNHALEHIADGHELHQLHPDLLDRIMHRHEECSCYGLQS